MHIKEFQKKCAGFVAKIDNKYKIKRDAHLSFTQLMEEIGELAKAINLPRLRNKKIDVENLREEFADVILQLFILAEFLNVDIEDAVNGKIGILIDKHKL